MRGSLKVSGMTFAGGAQMIRAQASISLPPLDPEPVRGRQEMLHQKIPLGPPRLESPVLLLLPPLLL